MSHSAVSRPAAGSVASPRPTAAKLVKKKIATSATKKLLIRQKRAKRKIIAVTKEHKRTAKTLGFSAVALTLTYANAKDFSPKHVTAFVAALRAALKRLGHPTLYLWRLERASALHYHLILWLPRSYRIGLAKLKKWWPWGSTWIAACRNVTDWSRYIAKLDATVKLPKGARLIGYGGLDAAGQVVVRRVSLPRWLLVVLPKGVVPRRHPGGGWIDPATGVLYRSPYLWTPTGIVLRSAGAAVATGSVRRIGALLPDLPFPPPSLATHGGGLLLAAA